MKNEQNGVLQYTTRAQDKLWLWFSHQAGRPTSSNMKRVCAAKIETPLSFQKRYLLTPCKENQCSFNSVERKHEPIARKKQGASGGKTRRFLYHHLWIICLTTISIHGGIPDRVPQCRCCGAGTIEIKLPFKSLKEGVTEHPCLTNNNGHTHLPHNHSYYYQTQTHLLVIQTTKCDYVMRTTNDMYIESVRLDRELQNAIQKKSVVCFSSYFFFLLLLF